MTIGRRRVWIAARSSFVAMALFSAAMPASATSLQLFIQFTADDSRIASPQGQPFVQAFKLNSVGHILTLDFESSDSVENILTTIEDKVGAPPQDDLLSFGAVPLVVGSTIGDYGIPNESIITASIATGVASVPEPAAWAMIVVGFGLIGGAIRRKGAVRLA
jgi:hypothetical protein